MPKSKEIIDATKWLSMSALTDIPDLERLGSRGEIPTAGILTFRRNRTILT